MKNKPDVVLQEKLHLHASWVISAGKTGKQLILEDADLSHLDSISAKWIDIGEGGKSVILTGDEINEWLAASEASGIRLQVRRRKNCLRDTF